MKEGYTFGGFYEPSPYKAETPVFEGVKKSGTFTMPGRWVNLYAQWIRFAIKHAGSDKSTVSFPSGNSDSMILAPGLESWKDWLTSLEAPDVVGQGWLYSSDSSWCYIDENYTVEAPASDETGYDPTDVSWLIYLRGEANRTGSTRTAILTFVQKETLLTKTLSVTQPSLQSEIAVRISSPTQILPSGTQYALRTVGPNGSVIPESDSDFDGTASVNDLFVLAHYYDGEWLNFPSSFIGKSIPSSSGTYICNEDSVQEEEVDHVKTGQPFRLAFLFTQNREVDVRVNLPATSFMKAKIVSHNNSYSQDVELELMTFSEFSPNSVADDIYCVLAMKESSAIDLSKFYTEGETLVWLKIEPFSGESSLMK
jgi:hypothetical protein